MWQTKRKPMKKYAISIISRMTLIRKLRIPPRHYCKLSRYSKKILTVKYWITVALIIRKMINNEIFVSVDSCCFCSIFYGMFICIYSLIIIIIRISRRKLLALVSLCFCLPLCYPSTNYY